MLNFLLGAVFAAQAPGASPSDMNAVDHQQDTDTSAVINNSPPDRLVRVLSGPDISLEISEKKSEATLGYAWRFDGRALTADGMGQRFSRTTLNLGVTVPVGGADNLLDGDTFDQLAEGPTLNLSLTTFGWTSRDRFGERPFLQLMEEAYRRCVANPGPRGLPHCDLNRTRPGRTFVQEYTDYSEATINRALSGPAFGFGIETELGFDVLDYRTPVTLAESSRTEPNLSATASIFFFPPDGVSLFAGTVEYKNRYKARDDVILCRAVVVDPNDDCASGPDGPPRHVESLSFGLEYRRSLGTISGLGTVGISPEVSYDVLRNNYHLEFPIYLTPEGKSAFRPGLTFSYDSEDHFVVGLFLRQPFGLGR